MQERTDSENMAKLTEEKVRGALRAAVVKATEIGSPSSVAIVDDGRNLLGFIRMDGALLASIEISQGKAYTARSMNMNTADIGPLTQPGQPLYGIETSHARPLITFGGGRPLMLNGEVVGAVGVAGGTVVQDDEVAVAAAASLG
jgi:uncharacterized protein GlcG (DUF336 family)